MGITKGLRRFATALLLAGLAGQRSFVVSQNLSQFRVPEPDGITRYSRPILAPNPALSETRVFNPSVIVRGTQLAMLYRADVEIGRGSQIRLAFSKDGRTFTPYLGNPVLSGDNPLDERGCEDPRVVMIKKVYYMTYVCNPEHGPQEQCMATSSDLIHWEKKDVVLRPQREWDEGQVKAGVIVPKKVAGKYVMYFAGQTFAWHTSLGMAVSDDLLHWKEPFEHPIMTARSNHFDSLGVEPGATPIVLPTGILLLYNGWNLEHIHKTGWVLFSKKDPAKIIDRSDGPFIEPQFPFEIEGHNAFTFTEGAVFYKGEWRFYYGAADRSIGLAEVKNLTALIRTQSPAKTRK
jgi:predicted GH43/DUF377 family glycosyl hydrolase